MKLFKRKKKRRTGHCHDFVLYKSPYTDPKYIFWYCRGVNCNVEVRWIRDNYNWATSSRRKTKYGYWSRIDGQYREWSN